MGGQEFFNVAAKLLATNPPSPPDPVAVAKLALIGVKEGQPVKPAPYLQPPVDDWPQTILALADKNGIDNNRWYARANKVGDYGDDYGARAIVAKYALGANKPEDARYLNTETSALLDSTITQTVTFTTKPPVKAFWSITVYNKNLLLVASPAGYEIDVCNINNKNQEIRPNSDGSITVIVQREKPTDPNANWLCAPDDGDGYHLDFRAYYPDPSNPEESLLGTEEKPMTWVMGTLEPYKKLP